jgi:hypothetical protein
MIDPFIWAPALAAYGLFRAWYDNWRGPLTAAEVDSFMARAANSGGTGAAHTELDVIRKFLEEDDGREFFMVNLVKIADGEVPHPDTGQPVPARQMMGLYTKAFMPALFARGGHPAMAARKVAGYVDAWKTPPDPGWSVVGFMRYRSRRDMMELTAMPGFAAGHPYKVAALAETFSFPTQPVMSLMAGPRLSVFLIIALAAAFAQIAEFALRHPA